VKLLLTYGANPRIGGEYGETPLTQAVSGGALSDIDWPRLGGCRLATVRALLERDPGLSIPDTYAGRSAIWWARFPGCAEVLAMVGARAEQRGQSARTQGRGQGAESEQTPAKRPLASYKEREPFRRAATCAPVNARLKASRSA